MPIQIALLRAINVAGRNKVAMSDLRNLADALGLSDARTLLQSGNLVFKSDRKTGSALEKLLEVETAKRLSVTVDYFVRTVAEWKRIVARNPFPAEAKHDPGHLVVMFLKQAPPAKAVKSLVDAIRGRESVRVVGKQAYIVYPDGIGRSKLTNALIETKLSTRGTARNWNTVLKLSEVAQE